MFTDLKIENKYIYRYIYILYIKKKKNYKLVALE